MSDTNTIVAHGYGGYGHILKYIPTTGAILVDSGVVQSRAPVGLGFDLEDFKTALQICPINPHEMKPSFSTKDWEEFGLQDSHAFEGEDEDDVEDTYYFRRAVALTTRPPSIWTGKMRLFMQCVYGSHNKKGMNKYLEIELQGQDNNKSTLSSLKLGTFELSSDVILFTDEENYRYFLIRIGVDSAQIAEIIFDKLGNRVLNRLRNDPDFSETPLEQVEGFLFSRAKEVPEPITVTGFDINSFGVPLWHWFHANKNGHSAAMVPMVQSDGGYVTRLCELDFTKDSVRHHEDREKWIDVWTIDLRVSGVSPLFCPVRATENFWIGTTAMFHPIPHVPGGGMVYCRYNSNDHLDIVSFNTGEMEPYVLIDSGWGNGSMDYYAMHCGLPNDSRQVEVRMNFRSAGFSSNNGGGAGYSTGYISRTKATISSYGAGETGIGSTDSFGGCDVTFTDIDTAPGVLSHPASYHLMEGTRTDTDQFESVTGSCFFYIPLNDAEAFFMGSRSESLKNTPNITSTPFAGTWAITHYNWRSAYPATTDEYGNVIPESPEYGTEREHVGDGVGTSLESNSTNVAWSPEQTYTEGTPDPSSSLSGFVSLREGGGEIDVSGHASLFMTPPYGNGSTGFTGYVQQSALTGKAVYSSGDGLAGDALCDGSSMGYYGVFVGVV